MSIINIGLDAAMLKAERARGDLFAHSPVHLIIINSNYCTNPTEHLSTLQPMLCTAPSACAAGPAYSLPLKLKTDDRSTQLSRLLYGASSKPNNTVFTINPRANQCKGIGNYPCTADCNSIANTSPAQSLSISNPSSTPSSSNCTVPIPIVNMAPASRSTTAARAKSAKSAGLDYVLRNKPKRGLKKAGVTEKSLEDLPGETLFPPNSDPKTPGEQTDANKGAEAAQEGSAPGQPKATASEGKDATESNENINDLLNSINNPTTTGGDEPRSGAEVKSRLPEMEVVGSSRLANPILMAFTPPQAGILNPICTPLFRDVAAVSHPCHVCE
jgi:hypothetical protein